MADNRFSAELAFRIARFSAYDKGKEYFADGGVKKIWQEGKTYKAVVQGTRPYRVSLKLNDEDEFEYDCSCPYESDGACKHVVAAILAFAADDKFIGKPLSGKHDENDLVIDGLIAKTTPGQLRAFIKKILIKQAQLFDDFNIFLQGQRQTPVSAIDYKTKFTDRLDQLDLRGLVEEWYRQGEDYYDDQYDYLGSESLSDVVDELMESGEKYEENQNFGEAVKIYQALFEALAEKQKSLTGDNKELSDWFDQEMEKVIGRYIKVLTKTDNGHLKQIGISYLCFLFREPSADDSQNQILNGLKQIIVGRDEAEYALKCLINLKTKRKLSIPESSLLAFLYFLSENWRLFEATSLNNLVENPGLTVDLLKYYQQKGSREKIIEVSGRVLKTLREKQRLTEVEIQIRRFLKNIYSPPEDYYPAMISNLERLFLITGSLKDYRELAGGYQDKAEKLKFWPEMKTYFSRKREIKILFKVFRLENQQEEVLNLMKQYPQAECFPEMIAFCQENFSRECFSVYKQKVEEILKEVKVEKYAEAAYHLKKMQKIGLDKEFNDFINFIKTAYYRRRRLLEELRDNQL